MASEFDLIRLVSQHVEAGAPGVVAGIGDDAAILDPGAGQQLVATMDTLNEGVHFLPKVDPGDLGHKSLAVNLSDLAAMGAVPRWLLLSLSMPHSDTHWVERFISDFLSLAKAHRAQLVGGDTCAGPLSVTVTALGTIAAGQSMRRSTARPGDLVVVSGWPGKAGYALQALRQGQEPSRDALQALHRPQPRIGLGRALVGKASACIDLSDGLLADLGHIANASGCGAEIDLGAMPATDELKALDAPGRWELQLTAGDDYELCFTLPPEQAGALGELASETGSTLTIVGRMVEPSGVHCLTPEGKHYQPSRAGHVHFDA